MDFQGVKGIRKMDLKFTDKIENFSYKLIRFHSVFNKRLCGKLFIDTDILLESITAEELCDFAAILFERDREDMLSIYDNNDIHALYEASLLTLKAKTDEEMINSSLNFKKVLVSYYLPEIKSFISYFNDDNFSNYLSDNKLTSYQDESNGEICYANQFGSRVSISY